MKQTRAVHLTEKQETESQETETHPTEEEAAAKRQDAQPITRRAL
jgi:hypothetical protein